MSSSDDLAARNFIHNLVNSTPSSRDTSLPFDNPPDHILDGLANVRAQNVQARERYHSQIVPLANHVPDQQAVDSHAFLEAPAFQCVLKKKYKFNGLPVTIHELISSFILNGDSLSGNRLRNFLQKKFHNALWLHERSGYADLHLDLCDPLVVDIFLKAKQYNFVTDLAPYAVYVTVGSEPDLGPFSDEMSVLSFRLTPPALMAG